MIYYAGVENKVLPREPTDIRINQEVKMQNATDLKTYIILHFDVKFNIFSLQKRTKGNMFSPPWRANLSIATLVRVGSRKLSLIHQEQDRVCKNRQFFGVYGMSSIFFKHYLKRYSENNTFNRI